MGQTASLDSGVFGITSAEPTARRCSSHGPPEDGWREPSLHWRDGVVPGSDGRSGSLVAEDRDARGIQREMRTGLGWKVAPPCAEDPQHVSVPEDGDIAIGLAEPSNRPVRP